MEEETLEQMQARHRKEQRDLQSRITSKKKNATKKTRKGVNDECAELERQLKERQQEEVARLIGGEGGEEVQGQEDGGNDDYDDVDGKLGPKVQNTSITRPPASVDATTGAGATKTTSQPPPQQQGDEGGTGKKRNRQKERLARRAAEAEAAAVAAESEAASMTDHRGIERTAMVQQFEANSLEEKEIAPDGHCLFSAVADQLTAVHGLGSLVVSEFAGDDDGKSIKEKEAGGGYKVVRQVAAGYMESHADDYAPFMEEPLDEYVEKIRDTAEWGGQLELSALANAYGVEIRVVKHDGRTEVISPSSHPDTAGGGKGEEKPPKTIWLAYYRHGYGLGEHYNSLRRKAAVS